MSRGCSPDLILTRGIDSSRNQPPWVKEGPPRSLVFGLGFLVYWINIEDLLLPFGLSRDELSGAGRRCEDHGPVMHNRRQRRAHSKTNKVGCEEQSIDFRRLIRKDLVRFFPCEIKASPQGRRPPSIALNPGPTSRLPAQVRSL
jgi:hypothetical protein